MQVSSIDELYELREAERERVLEAQAELNKVTAHLVENTTQQPLEITPSANKLFDVYLEYNTMVSDAQSNKYPISKLSRKHKQWLALKLAGTYAILHGEENITETMYAYAINTIELLAPNLSDFERELVKEPYEQLCALCHYKAEEGNFFLSLHELRKLSYVTGTGSSKSKVEELATLANSCDPHGSYTVQENGIQYQELVKTDVIGVSYILFESELEGKPLKDYMSTRCDSGFEFYETDFEDLKELLKENAVYGSFAFENGKRNKDNVRGGTKFVVLDIDKSMLTDTETHVLLNEYNHHIARTSDPHNEMKFRVILELDSVVDVNDRLWKALLEEIGDELGLIVDLLPRSQIYFSFRGREVLSQLEGTTLNTKNLLEKAALRLRDKPKPPATLPTKEKDARLSDPRETFAFAFEAEKGERSKCMYRALAYAIDLGADEEYVERMAHEINEYWNPSMDLHRLQKTLITPALRRV